jgi:hypothetical protein
LSQPTLYKSTYLLAVNLRFDIAKQMDMILSGRTNSIGPPTSLTDGRQVAFNMITLLSG